MFTPFWRSLVVPPASVPKNNTPTIPSTANVVIIGCGLTGASCAYWLGEFGQTDVVILDAKEFFCDGATGRNGGHQWPEVSEQGLSSNDKSVILSEIEMEDVAYVRKFISDLDEKDSISLEVTGGVSLSFDAKQSPFMKDYASKAKLTFLDSPSSKLPKLQDAKNLTGIMYPDPAQFCPAMLVSSLVKKSKTSKLFTGTKVESIKRRDAKWLVKVESGEEISCDRVVHASNGYGIDLLNLPFLQRTRGQVIAVRAPKGTAPLSIVYHCNEESCEEYLIQRRKDGIIIFGGCRHVSHDRGLEGDDSVVEDVVTNELMVQLQRLFPDTKLDLVNAWSGLMCFTPDKQPIVGELRPGEYVSVGYSGHGMVRAFSCGKHVAELISNRQPSCLNITKVFRVDRFS